MPKPPLLGEVASSEAKMSERLYRAAPVLFRSLERRPLSNLSDACGASSPGRGALGKEVSFSMKLVCVCWKTSRNAKASHFGRGVCGADGEGKDAAKEPDTQRYAPCLSEPSYRNAAGVISPGLPSQALTRQLPQSGSPWQRGFVFDETDLRLLENVTECQSLPYQGRWHRAKRRCRRGFVSTKTNPPHRASPVRGCGNGIRECLQALLSQKTTMRVLPP